MNRLEEILNAHNINGRDKAGGTDKATIHTYTDVYEKYLAPYIGKECSVLEIGVWEGGSSLLWQEYLQPKEICAIDIDDYRDKSVMQKMNGCFKFYQRNAYTKETSDLISNEFKNGFDIIIEDGLHTIESNEFAIKNYLPMLKDGGVMIIEDIPVNTPIEIPFGYSLKYPTLLQEMSAMISDMYKVEVIDLTQEKGRYDDILFIIKK